MGRAGIGRAGEGGFSGREGPGRGRFAAMARGVGSGASVISQTVEFERFSSVRSREMDVSPIDSKARS